MSPAARVVVVSHEATLTGAPRVAVEVVRALHDDDRDVVCVLRAKGPLTSDFAAAADSLRLEPLARPRALLRRFGPLRPAINRLDEVVAGFVLARTRPDLLFLNTVKSACYVRPALRRGIPVVLYSHELGVLAASTLNRYPLGRRWQDVRLMACSTAARDTLAQLVDVPPTRIEVVTSPVDVQAVIAAAGDPAEAPAGVQAVATHARGNDRPDAQVEATADRHGAPLPQAAPLVGACGTVDERKGADLWLQVAEKVRQRRPDVRFRWVGQRKSAWPDDIGGAEFTGALASPYPVLAAMDVFTLPSREDAFPLVVLEAMALARPIVAFDVGGVYDQLGDAGVLVPAGDTAAMADAVVDLLDNPEAAAALGAAARRRVTELYDIAPFHQAIRRVVA